MEMLKNSCFKSWTAHLLNAYLPHAVEGCLKHYKQLLKFLLKKMLAQLKSTIKPYCKSFSYFSYLSKKVKNNRKFIATF